MYWYHADTDTSSWTAPTLDRKAAERQRDFEAQSKTETDTATPKAAGGSRGRVSFGEDRVVEFGDNQTDREVGGEAERVTEVELAAGWEEGVSATTGKRYYHNPATGKSHTRARARAHTHTHTISLSLSLSHTTRRQESHSGSDLYRPGV